MATHSSVLTWRIPGTGEPGGLPSLGSHRVGHAATNGMEVEFSRCNFWEDTSKTGDWLSLNMTFTL